jgi:hypothetical protein
VALVAVVVAVDLGVGPAERAGRKELRAGHVGEPRQDEGAGVHERYRPPNHSDQIQR